MASIAQVADWATSHELIIRGTCFVSVLALMAFWEVYRPARALRLSRSVRWSNNLTLVALNTLLLRLLFPAAAVGMAAFTVTQGWGLLNYYEWPLWLATIVSVIVLDFVIWLST